MTADALLAAIRADPEADLPRLVYADHLDDAGDAAQAEFIRVQCELATLGDADPRRPTLEDREHELLDANEASWLGSLGDFDEWEWRRGFVDEVSGHYRHIWSRGEDGFAGHPVQRADVTTWRTGPNWPEGMPPGPWLACLRYLSLADTGTFPALLRQLVCSPHLAGLSALDVSRNPGLGELAGALGEASFAGGLRELSAGGDTTSAAGIDARWLATALLAAPLERLDLPDSGLAAGGLASLLAAPFAVRLTSLDVAGNRLSFDATPAFRRLPSDATLTRLDVSRTGLGTYALAPLLACGGLGRLTDLEVNHCDGFHRWGDDLARSEYWTQARSLRRHSAGDGAAQIVPLCQVAGPPGLQLLDLGHNDFGSEGVRHLVDARWGGSLTWLGLSRNRLDDGPVATLAGSGKFARLRILHLANNPLTDAGAAALAAAPSLARLRVLTLSHTRVTDQSVSVLLDAPRWRLDGLGLAGCDLSASAVHALATSPRLRRLQWLDLSGNPRLGGDALLPLAESPHLSRLCELDVGRVRASDRVRAALRQRLGRRLSD